MIPADRLVSSHEARLPSGIYLPCPRCHNKVIADVYSEKNLYTCRSCDSPWRVMIHYNGKGRHFVSLQTTN